MNKSLIVYGTRYGATASTSEEIAATFTKEGIEVQVFNAKEEKVKDISQYNLVIIGSGIQIDKWTNEPEDFLKKFQKELATKEVALFVSSGAQAIIGHEGKPEEIERGKKKYLQDKAAKYNLQPVALGLFGGIYDFNKWPWWAGKAKPIVKQQLKAAGFKETNGIYDTRDWKAIRDYAKELATRT
jgi:menaquinone-dependent protoporphyrinogen IX oxidase